MGKETEDLFWGSGFLGFSWGLCAEDGKTIFNLSKNGEIINAIFFNA